MAREFARSRRVEEQIQRILSDVMRAELRDVQAGLDRAAGFLRSQLARELATRTVPELRFRYDEAAQRARDLERLIDTAVAGDAAATGTPTPGPDGSP